MPREGRPDACPCDRKGVMRSCMCPIFTRRTWNGGVVASLDTGVVVLAAAALLQEPCPFISRPGRANGMCWNKSGRLFTRALTLRPLDVGF
jgi:hypothetical protein